MSYLCVLDAETIILIKLVETPNCGKLSLSYVVHRKGRQDAPLVESDIADDGMEG
jgi:hypothetical protein